MFARISTLGGNHVKEVVKFFKEANPPGLEGMKGGYVLAKENEKVITITLWESREAVEASLPAAKKILEEASHITGVAPKIEIYEVAMEI
ncbi:MAG: antibiotic biosynthesis monooxygenase family protein [Actinomycetota bacterium]